MRSNQMVSMDGFFHPLGEKEPIVFHCMCGLGSDRNIVVENYRGDIMNTRFKDREFPIGLQITTVPSKTVDEIKKRINKYMDTSYEKRYLYSDVGIHSVGRLVLYFGDVEFAPLQMAEVEVNSDD